MPRFCPFAASPRTMMRSRTRSVGRASQKSEDRRCSAEIAVGGADHIIVGSGINALVCAAMLAGKGGKVLVLERSDRIGGCIRTEEMTAPGLRPRRDGHHLRAVHHLTGLRGTCGPISAGTGSSSAMRRRRPACCSPTARMRCSAWTAPPTSPPSMPTPPATAIVTAGRRRDRTQCRPAVRAARWWLVELSDLQAARRRGVAAWARAALPAFLGQALDAGPQLAGKLLSVGDVAARCGRHGCCMPGSARKMRSPGRSPR